ncbi:MAG TPA: hypothetical protein VNK23_17585, partial [Candidatus Dormibacteraeota bacterium]|nr:hypothetical protein [Candidatus Dormibacteraeota bacterium]
MATTTRGLAVRPAATLDIVQEALASLTAKHRSDEVLTAIRQIPAREAEFRPMPKWVRPELA